MGLSGLILMAIGDRHKEAKYRIRCAVCDVEYLSAKTDRRVRTCSVACRQRLRYLRRLGPVRIRARIAMAEEDIVQMRRVLDLC